VSCGIVHYAFPVLNPQITQATGWPAGATTVAFSFGLVVSGGAVVGGVSLSSARCRWFILSGQAATPQ
jgi:hypothetical protein